MKLWDHLFIFRSHVNGVAPGALVKLVNSSKANQGLDVTFSYFPAGIFKVNNINTRALCEVCSKLAIKIPERRHFHCSL